jgi:hypothetical protein
MYFVLEQDRGTVFMAFAHDDNPGHDLKWSMGRLIEPDEQPRNLAVIVEDARERYPDFFTVVPTTFCSQRMRDALNAAGADNIEYYPVEMQEPSGKRLDGYFAMNIIGRIECMDRERSEFTEWRKRIARIQSLSLNASAPKGVKIFRPHEYPDIILISEDVAEAIRGFPGVSLMAAEGWSDAHRF